MARLGATEVLYVGATTASPDLDGVNCERLTVPHDAARGLKTRGRTIDYLAAVRNGAVALQGAEDPAQASFDVARTGLASCVSAFGSGLEHQCLASDLQLA